MESTRLGILFSRFLSATPLSLCAKPPSCDGPAATQPRIRLRAPFPGAPGARPELSTRELPARLRPRAWASGGPQDAVRGPHSGCIRVRATRLSGCERGGRPLALTSGRVRVWLVHSHPWHPRPGMSVRSRMRPAPLRPAACAWLRLPFTCSVSAFI